MSNKKLDRFGKYLLLDHLLDGGMNRIFRARYLGDTASKICAVKVVLPQYSQDPQFKTMFMDEIKVTFGLLHPNVVQTYDYGTHKGQLYVAMEYCDGRNLKEYLDKLKERKFVFPVEISVYIGTQICQGLHYAHTLSDKLSGKEMNIIHRDISPHNIMLTYDGSIKIIDFGIAKAETNSEATQAGTIKGKLSYLAPEYLEGNDLDARYDQFAVGITLWEMLCNRKLFKAPNDIAVLKKIQECNIPKPSSINPNVAPELDEIILKSLSKNPEERFDNMDMFNRALIKFLYSKYPDFNATDLSYFAKELFKEDIQKDREKLFEFGKIELGPYIEDMKAEAKGELTEEGDKVTSEKITNNKEDETQTKVSKSTVFDFGFSEEDSNKTKNGTRILSRKKVKKAISKSSASEGIQLDIEPSSEPAKRISVREAKKPTKSSASEDKTSLRRPVRPANATSTNTKRSLSPDKVDSSNNKSKKNLMPLMTAGVALIALVGYLFTSNSEKNLSKKRNVANVAVENSEQEIDVNSVAGEQENSGAVSVGRIEIQNYDKFKHGVYLNGKRVEVDVLGEISDVPFGDHFFRVQQKGLRHFVEIVSINKSNKTQKIKIPKLVPTEYGYLNLGYDCAKGSIEFSLFGEERVETVPFENQRGVLFPIQNGQEHLIYFKAVNDDLSRKFKFSINQEDDVVDMCQLIFE